MLPLIKVTASRADKSEASAGNFSSSGESESSVATVTLLCAVVVSFLQDLIDVLLACAEVASDPLKTTSLLHEVSDGWVLSGIDLHVIMAMF